MSVAETEASIVKIVSLKDPVDAMSRLRLLAPIETLVYRRDSDSADQSEGRPVVLVPKASSSLVDVINFLRSGDASAFDDRAKKIVRLGATVQLIQLLAALHTRKVVHGKLEPKSVLLFSHGLLYLSDLGRARRQGERFTTSRPSRYGAPEVLEHPETPYTYSRDAYSLGIILFELWCGRLPFDLGTPGVDSSEKLENSHPATLYQTVRNLDQRLSFDVCPSDMPESVKTLIRKFLTRRRWTRLVPQAALRDANFRRTMQLLQETVQGNVTDRVRGRLALRSSFEFRNEEAVGQSELASLASSMTVTAPEGEALEVAREAGLRSGASINLVSATTGEQVTVSLRAPLGIGEYTAVFSGFISGIDSELAVKAFLGKTTESMSVAETEASILKIVSLKDPVDAMSRLRLLAPIETLVYRRDSDSADQSEGRPVVLVPKASSSLVDVINFLRSGDASAFDDRAKKIVRLGATVQLIQLLAALHTRKVVHGKLEPKSVLLFSHGLLYLSDLGRARRHGERFTTSRPSRYGAPEVLEHPETPYTYSRDAYSLGIILFELWCGRLPFDLGTPGVDSSEKLENSHPVILYQTVRNLDQRLSFDVCPSDMPESVKTLIRKFLTRRRWTRLVPQAALRDANFRRTMQLLQETVQGNGETQV
uniref:Rhoptry kinase family protein ROP44 (Incomplete catalytic triad) n=1 Tax=Toxoplasma gondii (strain ATCC 50861 / VEG) TaxID=432359 RepID=A0A0F7UPE8_TOXGV|nr:TPA: Rhoptry kinase family protein ROP44 (incomplete catalytic triad) [Toxoplasma gondii VEG]